MAEDTQGAVKQIDPPRGMYNGRLDDKGRLKLPVDLAKYLDSFVDKKLFVTSVDRRTSQIYPMDVWRENEKMLATFTEEPEVAERFEFNASDLGGNAEVDGQGRVLFNPELRRELAMDGQALRLHVTQGHIEVMTETVYGEAKKAAVAQGREDAVRLKRFGIK